MSGWQPLADLLVIRNRGADSGRRHWFAEENLQDPTLDTKKGKYVSKSRVSHGGELGVHAFTRCLTKEQT